MLQCKSRHYRQRCFARRIIYERRHPRIVAEFGGLSHVMPGYATVFLAMTMTAIGLPLLCVFISEFLAVRGAFEAEPIWAAWAALGIILNAGYMLWLYQRMFFGNIDNPKNRNLPDLSGREWAYMTPLVILSLDRNLPDVHRTFSSRLTRRAKGAPRISIRDSRPRG